MARHAGIPRLPAICLSVTARGSLDLTELGAAKRGFGTCAPLGIGLPVIWWANGALGAVSVVVELVRRRWGVIRTPSHVCVGRRVVTRPSQRSAEPGSRAAAAALDPVVAGDERIGECWSYPQSRSFAELLMDYEEDRTLRAVLVGMLREADR